MNIDIRKNVTNNFKGNNSEEVISSIDMAIDSKDELVLPGLGVLLELAWKSLSKEEQEKFASLVIKNIQ